VLALVVEHVQLVFVKYWPLSLSRTKAVVFPAVPQARDHVVELGRALVAQGVLEVFVAVEVLRLADAARGHQVPARAPAADLVERRELARHVEGLVEAGGHGGDEADALGQRGNGRQQRERLEVIAARGARQRGQVAAAHAHRIGQEDRIELGGLGLLRSAT
jgi:hypothetical protein